MDKAALADLLERIRNIPEEDNTFQKIRAFLKTEQPDVDLPDMIEILEESGAYFEKCFKEDSLPESTFKKLRNLMPERRRRRIF